MNKRRGGKKAKLILDCIATVTFRSPVQR